jgi:hypothetical protein
VTAEWPVALRGVTESVVATRGPNDLWNVAALGLHASDEDPSDGGSAADGSAASAPHGDAVTARTWGNTRTRRNFHREGGGVVQFVSDPRTFVDAALTIREEEEAVLDEAHAWVQVRATRLDGGSSGGTRWEEWRLEPVTSAVVSETVPTINRGFYAVVEATVAASRLDVDAYDTETLLDRLAYFAETVERCGGTPEREAFDRLTEETEWREYRDGRADERSDE